MISASATAWTQGENSDVLPDASVAVAVMYCPSGSTSGKVTENGVSPPESVITLVEPR